MDICRSSGLIIITTLAALSGPCFAEQQWLFPDSSGDGAAFDEFGKSLDLSESMLAVGAWGDDDHGLNAGAVYVYERVGGHFNLRQKVVADNPPAPGLQLGIRVDLSRSGTLAAESQSGIIVFSRLTPGLPSWTQIARVEKPPECQTFYNPSISDEWLFVSCLGGPGASVRTYRLVNGVYVPRSTLVDPTGPNTGFGASSEVSEVGTSLIGRTQGIGLVYNFVLDSGGNWVNAGAMSALDGEAADGFGSSVAFCGSNVLVGAPGDNTIWGQGAGSVYQFDNVAGSQASGLKIAPQVRAGANFGFRVACDAQRGAGYALLDAMLQTGGPTGTVVVFSLGASFGQQLGKFGPDFVQEENLGGAFGYDIAISGDELISGVPYRSVQSPFQERAGAVSVNTAIDDLFRDGFESLSP